MWCAPVICAQVNKRLISASWWPCWTAACRCVWRLLRPTECLDLWLVLHTGENSGMSFHYELLNAVGCRPTHMVRTEQYVCTFLYPRPSQNRLCRGNFWEIGSVCWIYFPAVVMFCLVSAFLSVFFHQMVVLCSTTLSRKGQHVFTLTCSLQRTVESLLTRKTSNTIFLWNVMYW